MKQVGHSPTQPPSHQDFRRYLHSEIALIDKIDPYCQAIPACQRVQSTLHIASNDRHCYHCLNSASCTSNDVPNGHSRSRTAVRSLI